MSLSFSDYLNLIESGIYRQRIKLELLRYSDLSVYKEITGDVVKGSCNLTTERKNGVRRSSNFSLINSVIDDVGKYVPDIKNNVLSPRSPIRLYLGLANENNEEFYISQGIFFLASPSISSNFSQNIVNLELIDAFSIFNSQLGGELLSTYIIPLGTNLYTAINSILQTENSYPLPCILDSIYSLETNPYTITTEASSSFGDILIELALIVSGNLFFNREGQLTLSQDTNDNIKGSVYDFTTENAHYKGATSRYNYSEFFNSVLVIGSNINGLVYSAEATDNNLMSPTSVNNIGFKRQKRIENSNLNSTQKCQDLADYELKRLVSKQNEVSISSIPLYHIEADDVITLTDASLGFNKERFLINSINISDDQMTLNCVRAIDLPYND